MSGVVIRPAADERDIAWAASLIARSFDHLDIDRYVVPDAGERPGIMREFYGLLVAGAARGAGEVLITDGAVAVWFDRTTPVAEPADQGARLAEITGPYLPRFEELFRLFEKHDPTEPHWELAFLAVEPDRQGRGLGSTLMKHTHARLDEQGVAAFLHATNPDNQRVYRRHGYAGMDPAAVPLPDGSAFHPMWRPAA
nr:GNAT family N-acetyltransferase [uncultured Actinoplanes sp.]